jgi:hypothetical protein
MPIENDDDPPVVASGVSCISDHRSDHFIAVRSHIIGKLTIEVTSGAFKMGECLICTPRVNDLHATGRRLRHLTDSSVVPRHPPRNIRVKHAIATAARICRAFMTAPPSQVEVYGNNTKQYIFCRFLARVKPSI